MDQNLRHETRTVRVPKAESGKVIQSCPVMLYKHLRAMLGEEEVSPSAQKKCTKNPALTRFRAVSPTISGE